MLKIENFRSNMSGGLFQGGHASLPHGGGGGHPGGGMDGMENEMNQGMEQGVNPLLCFLCHQVALVVLLALYF